MATNIDPGVLRNFIVEKLGTQKITQPQAQQYGVDAKEFQEANQDENEYLDLDEIMNDDDLCARFATMYTEDLEERNETDPEKEKEEETKVKDKNESGV